MSFIFSKTCATGPTYRSAFKKGLLGLAMVLGSAFIAELKKMFDPEYSLSTSNTFSEGNLLSVASPSSFLIDLPMATGQVIMMNGLSEAFTTTLVMIAEKYPNGICKRKSNPHIALLSEIKARQDLQAEQDKEKVKDKIQDKNYVINETKIAKEQYKKQSEILKGELYKKEFLGK